MTSDSNDFASAQRPNTFAHSIFVRGVRTLTEISVAFLVAGFAAIICVQVFYRYVLNDSLVWSEELVRYGLLWSVMLGAALASDRNAHIALTPLKNVLSAKRYRVVAWISGLLIVAFCAIVGWYSVEYMYRLRMMTSPASQIPMPYVFAAIPLGCGLMSFFGLVHLFSGTYDDVTEPHESAAS